MPIAATATEPSDAKPAVSSSKRPSLGELFQPLAKPAWNLRYLITAAIVAGWGKFLLPLVVPWASGQVIDQALVPLANDAISTSQANTELLRYTIICAIAVATLAVATYFRHTLVVRIIARVQHALRRRLFTHLQRLSMRFFHRHHAGALGARVSSDIVHAGHLIDKGIVQYSMDGVFTIVATAFLLLISWQLALWTGVLVVLTLLLVRRHKPRLREQLKEVQERQSAVTGLAAEYFSGIALVKASAGEQASQASFEASSSSVRDLQWDTADLQGRFSATSFSMTLTTTAGVLILGSYMLINWPGTLALGTLVAFMFYCTYITGSIQRMLDAQVMILDGMAALERLNDILSQSPEPADRDDASMPKLDGELTFDQVTFAYEPNRPVLHGFTHHFSFGKTYALVGASGSGKSTIAQLLLRFFDPVAGQIRIDGHDLRDLRQTHYRQHVAIVLQDPILFSTTIGQNIAFAAEDSSQAAIERAARSAQAHDFIRCLPDGYDAPLGERGVNLSGGQRQRIAIARALIRDPRILILDEATSALDARTERSIQDVIDGLRGTRTVIVIAHRLSTIRNADAILVLDQGRLVEHGRYEDLMAKEGHFSKLVASQTFNDQPDGV